MKVIHFTLLFFLTGCATSLCPEYLGLSTENYIQQGDRGEVTKHPKTMDVSISEGGEVHALKVWVASEEEYYVGFYPVNAFDRAIYGPFNGTPSDDMACT